ncbi:glycosyl transferase family 2 [Leifsonia sp. Root227]|uniref:glycosyltransferase family 2 protein n=1 Tax=Leifsonia sp. Root227 TaxID=1736496 RepID=UPI0006F2AA2D|nr:glycosyltransferase family 2 protein [Leifsonia sp. Root227]KRC52237.1 glycosyl transferase family 2 [Leifsonia sp. Root227]
MTIDIMMPYYGDPELFRDAVRSVIAQTDQDWRLVVIDDVYPDTEPGEWVSGLGDARIHYLRNETNLGVSGNFTKSVELVTSEHFVLMGCDDLLEPGYVARMRAAIAAHPTGAYFQPAVTVIGDDGTQTLPLADRVKSWYRPSHSTPVELSGEKLAVSLLRGNWTYFPSICWRTDAVRRHGFDPEFDVVLDLNLQLDIVLDGGSLLLLPDHEFRYRRHSGSVSSWTAQDGSRFDEERAFFLTAAAVLKKHGWRRAARVSSAHWSSRLNAATKLPSALAKRDGAGMRSLLRHMFLGW